MNSGVHIAYVHAGEYPSNSPSMSFVIQNALGLAEHFGQVHLFLQENERAQSGREVRLLDEQHLPPGLRLHLLRTDWPRSLRPGHQLYFRKVYRSLVELARSGQVHQVVTRSIGFLPYLSRLSRCCPAVGTWLETHDFYSDLSRRDDIDIARKKRTSRLERRYLKGLTGVTCLQDAQRKLYREYYPALRIVVSPTGVSRFKTRSLTGDHVVYIGSLDPHKGVSDLLQALNLTRQRPPLTVIGGKSSREIEQLKRLAVQLYEPDKVQVTGWIDRDALARELAAARLGAVPLQDTFFNRFLTSPLKITDYLAAGLPVVAPDYPSLSRLVAKDRTGLLYEAGNMTQMAAAIDRMYADEILYRAMLPEVEHLADQLSWYNRARLLSLAMTETAAESELS